MSTVGFIGLGRLGLPLAGNLVDAGHDVVGVARGKSADLVERGGRIADGGTAKAVAEAADVVFTCLPSERELEATISGPDGLLAAAGDAPIVVDLTTAPVAEKARLREQLVARGGDLLDAPVSGTPAMAQMKMAIAYASGDEATHAKVEPLLKALSPGSVYVGPLGAGAAYKYVANILAFTHVTAAAEAMAFAKTAGLDLARVAEVIAASPGATSGQFSIRAPLMAQEKFESKLVTVDMMREVLDQISAAAQGLGAQIPLVSVVKELYDAFAADGEGDSDPAKLMLRLAAAEPAPAVS